MNAHACTSDEEAKSPKRMKTRRFRFHAILDNDLLSPTPLCEIYTAEIGDKRDIPKLLSLLPALPYNLVHLKRIKGSQIAICENVSDIPPDKIAQIKNLCVDDFIATKVPAIKAKVRSQYKDTQKHWPSSFHEDKLLEKKLNGSLFDEEQRQRFSELSMKVEKTNGAMFHDPRTKRIIIEVVGSGPTCMDDNALIKHPVMLMTQALAELQYNSNEKDDQYLATGFDAFLALEPCTMCAMALVHSRATRVFFVNPNEKLGALLTKWSLQNSKSINHHYEVYRKYKITQFNLQVNPAFRVREFAVRDTPFSCVEKEWNSSQIFEIADKISAQLSNFHNCLIGLAIEKSVLYVGAVVGVLRSNNAFVSIDPFQHKSNAKLILEQCKRLQVACLLSRHRLNPYSIEFVCPLTTPLCFTILHRDSINLTIGSGSSLSASPSKIIYAIQTSGSTGQPKVIHVFANAIMPNVLDFSVCFRLSSSSIVLFSTQLHFDPSIVELFLALHNGCELLLPLSYSDSSISYAKLIEYAILRVTSRSQINFVQLTPAHLQLFSQEFLKSLFGESSRVKHLLIGGDIFPFNLVRNYRHLRCSMRIFNVYGVTEVSCWASCHELEFDLNGDCNLGLVPIGEPLMDTSFSIDADKRLRIHGRQCAVDFKVEADSLLTEDIADIHETEENRKYIVVQGRRKPNSTLPSYEIEHILLSQYPQISSAKLVYADNSTFLFLNSFHDHTSIATDQLKKSIPPRLWPTRIFWNVLLHNFVTSNGKLDEMRMVVYAKQNLLSEDWAPNGAKFLENAYNIRIADDNAILDKSLLFIGFGSLQVAELTFLLEEHICPCQGINSGKLMQILLDDGTTLKILVDLLDNCLDCYRKRNCESCGRLKDHKNSVSDKQKDNVVVEICNDMSSFSILEWSLHMGKCIDASPLLVDGIVYVGSHAGAFRAVDVASGEVILSFDDKAFRIESTCAVSQKFIAVGALNGHLLLFHRPNHTLFKCVKTSAEIRMTPIFDLDETIFCGSYDGLLYKISPNGNVDSFDVTARGELGVMRSTPQIVGDIIFLATLKGNVLAINKISGIKIWTTRVDGPVFAGIIQLPRNSLCCIATVHGTVTSFSITEGNQGSSISLGETVFDTPAVHDDNKLLISGGNGTIFLLGTEPTLFLLKRLQFSGVNIVRAPITKYPYIFVVTTQGALFCISAENMEHAMAFDGTKILDIGEDSFGTPAIQYLRDGMYRIVIGSRGDLLRCFTVKILDINK